jgi:shikimate kinase
LEAFGQGLSPESVFALRASKEVVEQSSAKPSSHIVLIGLPGAGKSTIGPHVAERLHSGFLDLDTEIERRTGRSVPSIIRTDGEAAFRELEHKLTAELAKAAPAVLAPGGGWVTRPETVALLRPPARLVHLMVTPETAIRRLGRRKVARPLLDGKDATAALTALEVARRTAYASADWVVDTELLTVQRVIDIIVELVSTQGVG